MLMLPVLEPGFENNCRRQILYETEMKQDNVNFALLPWVHGALKQCFIWVTAILWGLQGKYYQTFPTSEEFAARCL